MAPNISEFYPTAPASVPPQLTKPNFHYRLRAFLVVASLVLFLLFYLALIVGFTVLSVWSFDRLVNVHEFDEYGAGAATLMIIGVGFIGFSSVLLALYFIKGLFKFPRGGDTNYTEITEAEQPRLFAFIRQVCADAGAPAPAKIFLSPEVNASVFYPCTFWSLFLPTKKNLHIGLGLVNCLNLSELKAVLAHEFGHFSQKSMRLGAFVYTTNRIIYEIIYGRDFIDNAIAAFDPVLNVIRWFLGAIFRVINFANSSLSRQMEFQADLVAVSVAGSDAIVNGLLRTDFAYQCLQHTWQDLTAAGDHGLWTNDIFHHQTKAAEHLRLLKDDPELGIPPALPDDPAQHAQVFPPNETVLPPMWASHPPHYEREVNCKRVYLRCPQDERPAWDLFDNAQELRERLTKRHHELARPKEPTEARPAEVVQKFIDDDRAETVYSARYHGMYEEGLISPGPIDSLTKEIPTRWEQPGKLAREHADIFKPELREWLIAYRERVKDQQRLVAFANKTEIPKGGVFQYRGKTHKTAEAAKLLEGLDKELNADNDSLASLDKRIFLVYMGMAGQLDGKKSNELEGRYRFHLAVQEMIISLTYWNRQIQEAFNAATAKRDASPEAIQAVGYALRQAQDAMGQHIVAAGTLRLPAFKNMRAGDPLSFFLDAKPVMHDMFGTEQIMNGEWLNQILKRHAEVIDKLRRILFKSLGSLLCYQERVGEQWKARHVNVPQPSLNSYAEPPTKPAKPASAPALQPAT
ncbi:MAG: M48 family metallopeptidase [Gemmataceae bacterium]|nr:M48 family metallopeptidase [Gemmataceae bacterium]